MVSSKKNNCCGCNACATVCPTSAVTMVPDELGFLYPHVDDEKCINCGKCDRVCPFTDGYTLEKNEVHDVFAARNHDAGILETSRSGGVFTALAQSVIEKGGIVYGAGFNTDLSICHKRAENTDGIAEFRGSKYAQSEIGNTFLLVKKDLDDGRVVLFSGTPCQIAGLLGTVNAKQREKLLLVDIICHGVDSPAIWKDYITFLQKKERQKIVAANFRDKTIFGWSGIHKESFLFEDGKKKTFDYVYYSDLHLRGSCNNCHFASLNRVSDITLGDFWGWRKCCPADFNADDKGCSLVICNTAKGAEALADVTNQLDVLTVTSESYIQPNLQRSTPKAARADEFKNDYTRRGFRYIRSKYGLVGIRYQWKRIMNFINRHLK